MGVEENHYQLSQRFKLRFFFFFCKTELLKQNPREVELIAGSALNHQETWFYFCVTAESASSVGIHVEEKLSMSHLLNTSMSGLFNYFLINSFNIKEVKDCSTLSTAQSATCVYLQPFLKAPCGFSCSCCEWVTSFLSRFHYPEEMHRNTRATTICSICG